MNAEQIMARVDELKKLKISAEALQKAHSLCDDDDDYCDHNLSVMAEAYGVIKIATKAIEVIEALQAENERLKRIIQNSAVNHGSCDYQECP